MEDKFTQADGEVLRKTGASMGVFNIGKGKRLDLNLGSYEERCSLCQGKAISQTKEIYAIFL